MALLAAAVTNCFLHHYRNKPDERNPAQAKQKKKVTQAEFASVSWVWAVLDSNQ